MGMLFDEPFAPVNFAAPRTRIVVRDSAPAYRWIRIQHGYAKLARGPEDFIGILHAMGLPGSFLMGWLTIIVELLGGLLILMGALIPLATLPMMIVLLVAIITVHLPNGFSSIKLQSFDAAGAHFGQPDMKPTCSISLAFLRWALEDLGRCQLTAGSTGLWENHHVLHLTRHRRFRRV